MTKVLTTADLARMTDVELRKLAKNASFFDKVRVATSLRTFPLRDGALEELSRRGDNRALYQRESTIEQGWAAR